MNHKSPYLWLTNNISGPPTKGREGGAVCSTSKSFGTIANSSRQASGGFSLFGGKAEKWEAAADQYIAAANAFRMQKQSQIALVFIVATARANIRIQIAKRDNVSRKRLRFSQPNSRNQMTWRILSRRHSRYAYSQATQKTILTGIFEFRSTGKNRPRS